MSDRGDLTGRASIRNEALQLFAEHGPDAVTIRRIAAAAEVSPALVIHHFGSKQGLREEVDSYVAGVFDEAFALFDTDDPQAMAELLSQGSGGSLAELLLAHTSAGPPVFGYLRRLLLSGDETGTRLFRRWFAATGRMTEAMVRAGVMRPGADPAVRTAFLMVNDLAALLLREQIADVLDTDLLSEQGMARWFEEVLTVYREGLFAIREE